MPVTTKELAEAIGARLQGDPGVTLFACAPIELAAPGLVTFLANPKYTQQVLGSQASALICAQPLEGFAGAQLIMENPYVGFALALKLFAPPAQHPEPGISPQAWVHETAKVDKTAIVYPFVYVGPKARIGPRCVLMAGVFVGAEATMEEDCLIHPNSVIRERCSLGKRVILQPNVSVGGDGFGYAKDKDGTHVKIEQIGSVSLEDDVEIGAGTCIDRATLGVTRVGKGTKIDDLVMVAHNLDIGERTIICGQTGIAGSTKIGDDVVLGAQVGIAGHLKIGNNVMLGATTLIGKDVPDDAQLQGRPAMALRTWLRTLNIFQKLPEIYKRLRDLEAKFEQLEKDGR